MKPLTEKDIRITHEDAYYCGNEVIIATNKQEEVKADILKNQENARKYTEMDDLMKHLPHEFNQYLAVYKQLKKLIERPLHYNYNGEDMIKKSELQEILDGKE